MGNFLSIHDSKFNALGDRINEIERSFSELNFSDTQLTELIEELTSIIENIRKDYIDIDDTKLHCDYFNAYAKAVQLKGRLLVMDNDLDTALDILSAPLEKLERFVKSDKGKINLIYFDCALLYTVKHMIFNKKLCNNFLIKQYFPDDFELLNFTSELSSSNSFDDEKIYYVLKNQGDSTSLHRYNSGYSFQVDTRHIELFDTLTRSYFKNHNLNDESKLVELKKKIMVYHKAAREQAKEHAITAFQNAENYYKLIKFKKNDISAKNYLEMMIIKVCFYIRDYSKSELFSNRLIDLIIPNIVEMMNLKVNQEKVYYCLACAYARLKMRYLFDYCKKKSGKEGIYLEFTDSTFKSTSSQFPEFIKQAVKLREILQKFSSKKEIEEFDSKLFDVIKDSDTSRKVTLRYIYGDIPFWIVEKEIYYHQNFDKEYKLLRRLNGCHLEIVRKGHESENDNFYSHKLVYNIVRDSHDNSHYEWRLYRYKDSIIGEEKKINIDQVDGLSELLPTDVTDDLSIPVNILVNLEKRIAEHEPNKHFFEYFACLKPESSEPKLIFPYYSATVQGLLDNGKPINKYDIHIIAVQTATALLYLHEAVGVIHGDLKPSNLLLDGKPFGYQVKVTDFDCSQKIGSRITSRVGTDDWASPEMLNVSEENPLEIIPGIDLFSFAKTIFFLLWAPNFSGINFNNLKDDDRVSLPNHSRNLEVHSLWTSCRKVNAEERGTARAALNLLQKKPLVEAINFGRSTNPI